MVRRVSRVSGAAALVVLASGSAGVVAPLVALGVTLVVPGAVRQSAIRLQRAPQRLLARQAYIDAEASAAFRKLFRRGNSQARLLRRLPSSQASAAAYSARPTEIYNVAPGEYRRTCREIAWTGRELTITDRRGATLAWDTTTGGLLRGFDLRRSAPVPDLGDLQVAALAATAVRSMPTDRVHLLDRWSRRLATVPVLGFSDDALIAVAAHAGVAISFHEIPPRVLATSETLVGALFPRSVHARRPAGIGPEWRWLERVRLLTRLLSGVAEESMGTDLQAERAARQATRRPR